MEQDKKNNIEKTKKKYSALAQGRSLPISKKHSMYLCTYVKNKSLDDAIHQLEDVRKLKRAIPFKGEIPHRKGIMSGRYPVKAARYMINILKALKGNALTNGLDIKKTRISQASSHWASRPLRSGGRRAKRTNVLLIAREIQQEGI